MEEGQSKKQILKSTGIVGGAQVITILAGIARTKVVAVLLGAAGVGLAGLFQSTIDLIRGFAGMGLSFSAVREIAKASATDDKNDISVTIKVVRRLILITGIIGTLAGMIFCRQLSQYTFGSDKYALEIAILSTAILAYTVSAGQMALLQGLRHITEMTRASIYTVLTLLVLVIPVFAIWKQAGIVPSILLTAFVTLFYSWLYSRKIKLPQVTITRNDIVTKGTFLFRLGIMSLISGLVETGVMYFVRTFINKRSGLEDVGQFTAAWSISTMYLSAILNAMGADYYPRLSTQQHDNSLMNRSVNEQTEIALLIGVPVIVGMISFIDIVTLVLYSSKFKGTSVLLHWQLLGDFFKIAAWPIGFALLAKGKDKTFLVTNVLWGVCYPLTILILWQYKGIVSTGIGFLIAYIVYLAVVYWIANKGFQFRWTPKVSINLLVSSTFLMLAFLSAVYVPKPYNFVLGAVITLGSITFSFHHLSKIIDIKSIARKIGLAR